MLSRQNKKLVLAVLLFVPLWVSAEARIEKNVVVGMVSGLALIMDVHYPENPNGYGIVHVSGSGWSRPLSYNARLLSESQVGIFGTPLVEHGYTVFSLNHRATPRFQFPDPLLDVQRAVRFIRHNATEYGIDPARIGAVGGSSGGHLVSLLGVLDGEGIVDDPDPINRESAKIQTVVARAAPTDLNQMSNSAALSLLIGSQTSIDAGAPEARRYSDASPINYITSDDPPVLLLHGDQDQTVPYDQSVNFLAELKANNIEAELIRVPGAGHGPTFPGAVNPPDYIEEMVGWFDHHLAR